MKLEAARFNPVVELSASSSHSGIATAMPSPFPGMNPYLEHPERWSTVHNRLIVALADVLARCMLEPLPDNAESSCL
jgi:hypothetical protein